MKANSTIVPILIHASINILSRGDFLIHPSKVMIFIRNPITCDKFENISTTELSNILRQELLRMKEEAGLN